MNKEDRIIFLIEKTCSLPKKGINCLLPCCKCGCKEDGFRCTCGECKRYKCLDCRILGKNEFCKALTQLQIEDL